MLGYSMSRTERAWGVARATGIWLGMAVVSGLALESARLDTLALVAALGTLAAMSRRRWAFVAPLGAAALLEPTILPWAVAAMAISWDAGPSFAPPRLDSEPQRQLMRSRRRNEAASVVVVRANRPTEPPQLWPSLRVTDGFDLEHGRDGIELRAVLEDEALDRTAFAERIRGVLGASDVRFGWASFPADGVTLEVLVDAAREDLTSADARSGSPVTEPAPVPLAVRAPAPAIAEGS
jgi:hypothetical protein